MSYNALILEKLGADRYLAHILDKSLSETGQLVLNQAKRMADGFTRLSWYSPCFFDNYQEVCSALKKEDFLFSKAILKLIRNPRTLQRTICNRCRNALFLTSAKTG